MKKCSHTVRHQGGPNPESGGTNCDAFAGIGCKRTTRHAREKLAAYITDFGAFDLLVFGASMHAGGLEQELVEFINRHKQKIESKPRPFFLVLLSAATRDPELSRFARGRSQQDGKTILTIQR